MQASMECKGRYTCWGLLVEEDAGLEIQSTILFLYGLGSRKSGAQEGILSSGSWVEGS